LLTDVFTDLNQSATTSTLTVFFTQLNDVTYAGQFGWQGLACGTFVFLSRLGSCGRRFVITTLDCIDTRIGFIK
jgi:hypothetical protein